MKTPAPLLPAIAFALALQVPPTARAQVGVEEYKRKMNEISARQRQTQSGVNQALSQPFGSPTGGDPQSPAYYRQKAAEYRALAAEQEQQAAKVGGPKSTLGPQYLQAAEGYRKAAAEYDARAANAGTGGTGDGGFNSYGTTPSFGTTPQAQQLQQFQNSLVGLANAFQAMEARKEQREAAQRESARQQQEEARLERLRQDHEKLEESRERFGSLSALLGSGSPARTVPKPPSNPLDADWLLGADAPKSAPLVAGGEPAIQEPFDHSVTPTWTPWYRMMDAKGMFFTDLDIAYRRKADGLPNATNDEPLSWGIRNRSTTAIKIEYRIYATTGSGNPSGWRTFTAVIPPGKTFQARPINCYQAMSAQVVNMGSPTAEELQAYGFAPPVQKINLQEALDGLLSPLK